MFTWISEKYIARGVHASKCSLEGEIKGIASCKEACETLGFQWNGRELQEGQQCYTRGIKKGCFQDGKMEEGNSKLICRIMKDNHGRYTIETSKYYNLVEAWYQTN